MKQCADSTSKDSAGGSADMLPATLTVPFSLYIPLFCHAILKLLARHAALHVFCCSNDVRRFDDGISFWLFVWAGPLEAALVLLMVSLELGFVPAVCGMAAMLAVIPIQVICCDVTTTVTRLRPEP
jgi:hypothetical protein